MESPDVYTLAQVRWQFFGTLTFKSERLPERVRLRMWFATMRKVAKAFGVHFRRLPWCLRMENGELFGRRHFHFLLTGLPRRVVAVQTCFFIMDLWEKMGGGFARVTVFDHKLNGVGYISKCLGESADQADVYESAKFGHRSSDLMPSHALEHLLLARANETERRLAHRRKTGESTAG